MAEENIAVYLTQLLARANLTPGQLSQLLKARNQPRTAQAIRDNLSGKAIPGPQTIRAYADVPALRRAGADYEMMMLLAGHFTAVTPNQRAAVEHHIREAAATYDALSPAARRFLPVFEALSPRDQQALMDLAQHLLNRAPDRDEA